jgi:hypothetical protein
MGRRGHHRRAACIPAPRRQAGLPEDAGGVRRVNGGAHANAQSVDREYGIGTGRTDILVRKPWTGPDGMPALQMEAIELKVRTAKTGDPLPEALIQLDGYLSRCGLDDGHLLIFDRRPAAVRQEIQPRISQKITASGRAATHVVPRSSTHRPDYRQDTCS